VRTVPSIGRALPWALGIFLGASVAQAQVPRFAYVGAGNDPNPSFVSAFTVDPTTGGLTEIQGSPFLTGASYGWQPSLHPSRRFMYMGHFEPSPHISGLRVDDVTGALTPVPGSPFRSDADLVPRIHPDGRHLYEVDSAGIGFGSRIWIYKIDPDTGALTVTGPPVDTPSLLIDVHFDHTGRFLYAQGGGAYRVIHGYAIDPSSGALTEMPGSPFSTPDRILSINLDPLNRFLFVSGGCGGCVSGAVAVFGIDPDTGGLAQVAGSPFATGLTPSPLTVEPGGRFGYLTAISDTPRRTVVKVYAYDIDGSGRLSLIHKKAVLYGGGVSLDPQARFAYVLARPPGMPGRIQVFQIDQVSHALREVDASQSTPNPIDLVIDFTGSFAYVTDDSPPSVFAYAIDQQSGVLTPVAGSPYPVGFNPGQVILTPGP